MADKLFAYDGVIADFGLTLVDDFPGHLGHILRVSSQDFMLEILDDFRPPLDPLVFCSFNLLPVFQGQNIRQIRVRICRRFIMIGMIGG